MGFWDFVQGVLEVVEKDNEISSLNSQIEAVDRQIADLKSDFLGSILNFEQLEELRRKRQELVNERDDLIEERDSMTG